MPRLWFGCSTISCISPRRRKTFEINEKYQKPEINKTLKQRTENISIISTTKILNDKQIRKTITKQTIKNNFYDTDRYGKTNLSTQKAKTQINKDTKSSAVRASLSGIFQISKEHKIPSPIPLTIDYSSDENYDETTGSTSSDWSTSTTSYSNSNTKRSKHRSYTETYDLTKQNMSHKKHAVQSKPKINDIQLLDKSKSMSKSVRKTIKDQNIQQSEKSVTDEKQ